MTVVPLTRNAQRPRVASGYRVVRNAAADSAEMYLYGVIGAGGWFGDGSEISADQFRKDLKGLGNIKSLDVHINSEGGDVFDAKAIYTLLVAHKAKIAVYIDGLAASAASFIAMAGDTIAIGESAFVMIHNAWSFAVGNAADLRQSANLLEAVDGTMADVYAARSKADVAEIRKMMSEETWMNGKEAVANGFADSLVANLKVAASVRDTSRFRHLPAALRPNRAAAASVLDEMAALLRR